jgi:hypothetical protein
MQIRFLILFDPDPVPTFHPDADPDLQIDAYQDPDPAYHSDVDPDPDFYLMRIWIQVTKMMRIHANPDPDPQHFI